jgi:RNA polymerase sigma-70 factor (ECF subfamily)
VGHPLSTLAPIEVPPPPTSEDDTDHQDRGLVQRARGGDRDALEELLRQQYPQIHAVCRRITGHDADAADAAQNALISITRGLARFDDRSRFSTWAYRIAVNSSIDELRRRARRQAVSLDDLDGVAQIGLTAPVGSGPGGDPDLSAARLDVDAALRRLPVDFRAAVVLRDMCGLDYAEIAEVLQLPPGTVRSRIARGRAALVRLLEPTRSEP